MLSRLQHHIDVNDLHAVVVSHLHSDHISDIFIMRYALKSAMEKGTRKRPLTLFAPGEPLQEFNRLPYKDLYRVEVLDAESELNIGPFKLAFLKTNHSITCYAVAVRVGEQKALVYSGDTEYFDGLAHFCRDSSLFLCEANYLHKELEKGAANHLSARQAAAIAKEAAVKRLLLTHLHPLEPPASYLQEASSVFKGAELAREGASYNLF